MSTILHVRPVSFLRNIAKNFPQDVLLLKNTVPEDRGGGLRGDVRWLAIGDIERFKI